jgi:hypothetical protein
MDRSWPKCELAALDPLDEVRVVGSDVMENTRQITLMAFARANVLDAPLGKLDWEWRVAV